MCGGWEEGFCWVDLWSERHIQDFCKSASKVHSPLASTSYHHLLRMQTDTPGRTVFCSYMVIIRTVIWSVLILPLFALRIELASFVTFSQNLMLWHPHKPHTLSILSLGPSTEPQSYLRAGHIGQSSYSIKCCLLNSFILNWSISLFSNSAKQTNKKCCYGMCFKFQLITPKNHQWHSTVVNE